MEQKGADGVHLLLFLLCPIADRWEIFCGILGGAMVYYFYYEALCLYAEEYFSKI